MIVSLRKSLEFLCQFLELTMAVFRTCVQKKRSDGFYVVYIRIAHNNSIAYIKTDFLVSSADIKRGEIHNPVVNKQCSAYITEYVDKCNKVNIKKWSAKEIALR